MIDAGIASKMLVFSLKIILKSRMKDSFDSIAENNSKLRESKISISSPSINKTHSRTKERSPAGGVVMKLLLLRLWKKWER